MGAFIEVSLPGKLLMHYFYKLRCRDDEFEGSLSVRAVEEIEDLSSQAFDFAVRDELLSFDAQLALSDQQVEVTLGVFSRPLRVLARAGEIRERRVTFLPGNHHILLEEFLLVCEVRYLSFKLLLVFLTSFEVHLRLGPRSELIGS